MRPAIKPRGVRRARDRVATFRASAVSRVLGQGGRVEVMVSTRHTAQHSINQYVCTSARATSYRVALVGPLVTHVSSHAAHAACLQGFFRKCVPVTRCVIGARWSRGARVWATGFVISHGNSESISLSLHISCVKRNFTFPSECERE